MKYEITKDKEDLYVLSINSMVVLISRDIVRITDEIVDDALSRLTNPKRVYEPAIIDLEIAKEEKIVEFKEDKSPKLGQLFNL